MNDLDDFLGHLSTEKNYSPNTVMAYQRDLLQFNRYLSVHLAMDSMIQVTHAHVRSWMVFLMQDNYTPKSINRKISSLKSFFKYLKKRNLVQHNPMTKVITPKIGKRLPVYVREDVMLSNPPIHTSESTFSSLRDSLIIEILYNTGLRRMELIQLKESDVEPGRLELRVLGKGNKMRVVPITPVLLSSIKDYLELKHQTFQPPSPFLIVTDKGRQAYPKFIYNKVTRWIGSVTTLEKRSPHILRHTFATHMINGGADLNAIKEILGHASLASTQVYTHNTTDQLKRVYKKAHPKAE